MVRLIKRILVSAFLMMFILLSTSACALPTVIIDSPENITYDTASIDLNWSVDENLSDAYYNLNAGSDVSLEETIISGNNWSINNTIISGLGDVGYGSMPTIFEKDSIWYLISGEYYGTFIGYNWTGSTWQGDSAIISGLNDVGEFSIPTVFEMNGTWYLISGEECGNFNGYNWTGSAWQNDTAIISGLGDIGVYSTPSAFHKDGTLYLITGERYGNFGGYNWTGSTWQGDSNLISGLDDVGDNSNPIVFEKNSTWYLISGEGLGIFNGYNWTGSAWQSDTAIISGLNDVGDISTPIVFEKDSVWYLISGEFDGIFNGYNWIPSSSTSSFTNTTITASEGQNNVTVWGNDTSDNLNSSTVYFFVDTIDPQVSFTALTPDDLSTVQTAMVTINLSVSDDNLDMVILSWNDTNETLEETEVVKTFGDDGIYIYYACANDTAGNVNCTESRVVTSEYQSYQVYLKSVATITATKKIGEIPAGAILGLTENVGIGTAIQFVILAVVIGFGLFGYSSIKAGRGLKS